LKAHHKGRESYVNNDMFKYDRRSISQEHIHLPIDALIMGMLSFSAYQLILEVQVCDEELPEYILE
jgi:hypothetical protein